jgi:hypothetical protein
LAWGAALLSALLLLYIYATRPRDWAWWQVGLAMLIAADVGGGMVANSLNSCKRYYHTPARSDAPRYVRFLKAPLAFAALHVYPLLVSLLFRGGPWWYGGFWYAYVLGWSALVLRLPLYLHRPVAMLGVLAALLLNATLVPVVPGFTWLAPALVLKVVLAHLVREEPYRPDPSPGESIGQVHDQRGCRSGRDQRR